MLSHLIYELRISIFIIAIVIASEPNNNIPKIIRLTLLAIFIRVAGPWIFSQGLNNSAPTNIANVPLLLEASFTSTEDRDDEPDEPAQSTKVTGDTCLGSGDTVADLADARDAAPNPAEYLSPFSNDSEEPSGDSDCQCAGCVKEREPLPALPDDGSAEMTGK